VRQATVIRLVAAIVLCTLITAASTACSDRNSGTNIPGHPAFVTRVFVVDGSIWLIRAENSSPDRIRQLNTVNDGGGETTMMSFQWGSSPVYSAFHGLFFYVDDDSLYSYDPRSGAVETICITGEKSRFVCVVTENYVIIANTGDYTNFGPTTIVNLVTKEVTRCYGLDWGPPSILDTYGDKIIHGGSHSKSVNIFDCATDSSVELYKVAPNSNYSINNGCIVDNSLFFIEWTPHGRLSVIENFDTETPMRAQQVKGVNRSIAGVKSFGDRVICAARESTSADQNRILFFYLYPDGEFVHFTTWEDAKSWGFGSLSMVVADGYLVARTTMNEDIFIYELPTIPAGD